MYLVKLEAVTKAHIYVANEASGPVRRFVPSTYPQYASVYVVRAWES